MVKKILSYITYGSQILTALAKGLEVVSDNWPTNSPFSNSVADKVPDQDASIITDKVDSAG